MVNKLQNAALCLKTIFDTASPIPTGVKYSFQFSIYHEIKINTNSSPLRLVSVTGWIKSFLLA